VLWKIRLKEKRTRNSDKDEKCGQNNNVHIPFLE
jgi:hypothetical protein